MWCVWLHFSILRGSPDRLFMDTSEDIFFSGWDVCQHGAYVCIFSFPCLRFISCLDRSIDGFRAPYGVVFIFYFLNIRVSETVVFITVIGGHVPDIVEIFLIRQVDFHHSVGVFDDLVVIIRFRNAFVVFIFQYSMVSGSYSHTLSLPLKSMVRVCVNPQNPIPVRCCMPPS